MLGLVKYCALPTYSGHKKANLHPDSPNPASQIPRLFLADKKDPDMAAAVDIIHILRNLSAVSETSKGSAHPVSKASEGERTE